MFNKSTNVSPTFQLFLFGTILEVPEEILYISSSVVGAFFCHEETVRKWRFNMCLMHVDIVEKVVCNYHRQWFVMVKVLRMGSNH